MPLPLLLGPLGAGGAGGRVGALGAAGADFCALLVAAGTDGGFVVPAADFGFPTDVAADGADCFGTAGCADD